MLKLQYRCALEPVLNSNTDETKIKKYPLITVGAADDEGLEYASVEDIVDIYFVPFLQAMGYSHIEHLYTDKQVNEELKYAKEHPSES